MKTGIGQRGKHAEKAVREYLETVNNRIAEFEFERIYDARAAGGRFPARTGDFVLIMPLSYVTLEVKEVDHESRLPKKNFKNDQIARLHKRQLAGGTVEILVFHAPSRTWRAPCLDFFLSRLHDSSWDLSGFASFVSCGQALESKLPQLKARR